MAAQLSLASATVTNDNGEQVAKDQPVLVRQNVLRIGVGNAMVYEDVQAVTQTSRDVWTVTLPGSIVFTVNRGEDCGCGS